MASSSFLEDDFLAAVRAGGARARLETLQAGVPVFYRDFTRRIDIMEQPSGRKYEVRFIPGASRDRNYEIVRELVEPVA